MKCGVLAVLFLGLAAACSSKVGAGAAASSSFWIRINVAHLFWDACLALLRLLPAFFCLLTVIFLAPAARADGVGLAAPLADVVSVVSLSPPRRLWPQ